MTVTVAVVTPSCRAGTTSGRSSATIGAFARRSCCDGRPFAPPTVSSTTVCAAVAGTVFVSTRSSCGGCSYVLAASRARSQ